MKRFRVDEDKQQPLKKSKTIQELTNLNVLQDQGRSTKRWDVECAITQLTEQNNTLRVELQQQKETNNNIINSMQALFNRILKLESLQSANCGMQYISRQHDIS
jgi:hypothetical protein